MGEFYQLTDKNSMKVIVLSNLESREARAEDIFLADQLSRRVPTEVVDLSNFERFQRPDTFFLIRNIWGRPRDFMVKSNYVNHFLGACDQKGKKYLVHLYKKGYPVIPTFSSFQEALNYKAAFYLSKPLHGSDGIGIKKLSHKELQHIAEDDEVVIQPFLEHAYETSFFFIDAQFQYALKTKKHRWDLELYEPDKKELSVAQNFADWNSFKGIQRIDFLHATAGQFLLEIEDWCPYLSLLDVPNVPADAFIETLYKTLLAVVTFSASC